METAILSIKEEFGAQLHHIICKKVGHQDYCHDIMQEVYLKIMLNLPKVTSADNTAAYLVRLTKNAVTDHFRKPQIAANSELPADMEADPEPSSEQSLQLADCCLRPMIDLLPGIYRDALVRTELEGMKYKDYANWAGISLSNAKVRVQRAKERLKTIILDCCKYEFDKYGHIVDCRKNTQTSCCKK